MRPCPKYTVRGSGKQLSASTQTRIRSRGYAEVLFSWRLHIGQAGESPGKTGGGEIVKQPCCCGLLDIK